MVVFISYETEPFTAFELQLLDPRLYNKLKLDGDFDLEDVELVISHRRSDTFSSCFCASRPHNFETLRIVLTLKQRP